MTDINSKKDIKKPVETLAKCTIKNKGVDRLRKLLSLRHIYPDDQRDSKKK